MDASVGIRLEKQGGPKGELVWRGLPAGFAVVCSSVKCQVQLGPRWLALGKQACGGAAKEQKKWCETRKSVGVCFWSVH